MRGSHDGFGLYNVDNTRWRHQMEAFPRYWPFVRGIHRLPVNSSERTSNVDFENSLTWVRTICETKSRMTGDLRLYDVHVTLSKGNFGGETDKFEKREILGPWTATKLLCCHTNARLMRELHGTVYLGYRDYKYSLLMHCIKIKSPAKFLLNEQYVFVGGNISFLCVLSCSSEEA